MAKSQTSGIEKETKCTAAIAVAFTIAKPGADDDTDSVSTAVTESLIGIFQHTTVAAGDTVRLMMTGISRIKLGGTVTRGDRLTSDAAAKGVTAAPATGVNNSIIGTALQSGVNGDIISVFLAPGEIQGA